MLKNYLITAWNVFLRRKFFTFINLFGIVLTLVVLIVAAAIADGVLSPTGPEKYSNNYLTIKRVSAFSADGNSNWASGLGYHYIKNHVKILTTPEKMSFYTSSFTSAAFKDGAKISHTMRRVDATYWEILDFEFIEGRAFNQQEFDSGQFLVVINEKLRDSYFNQTNVIGKSITVNNQRFTVAGVVKNVSQLELEAAADIWAPYTTSPSTAYKEQFLGDWSAMLYSSKPNGLKAIQNEYLNIVKNNFRPKDPEEFARAISAADTKFEAIARNTINNNDDFDSGANQLILSAIVLIILFMLLPSINMININVSRIMERSTEIGLRKAFGASSKHLVGQFLVESILLTAIGGIFGFAFAYGVLQFIVSVDLIPNAQFTINLKIFISGLVLILLFGLMSGIYPAWKMSKLHPVNALKGEV